MLQGVAIRPLDLGGLQVIVSADFAAGVSGANARFNAVKGRRGNVDFPDAEAHAFAEVVGQYARAAVEHQRDGNETRRLLKDIKPQLRRLLVVAVGVAYRNGEGVNAVAL